MTGYRFTRRGMAGNPNYLGMYKRRYMDDRGFTLVELLVTITILAVLVSLFLVGIPAIKRKMESTRCLNNLRQVGSAIFAYSADFNGQLMPRSANDVPSKEPKGWPYRLLSFGYLSDPNVLFCPSFFPRNNEEAKYRPTDQNASQTYGMRDWVIPGKTNVEENKYVHKPLAAITHPADFFIVADSLWTSEGWNSQGYGISAAKGGGGKQLVHLRHDKMANALFADGHVAAMPGEYFLTLTDPGRQPEYSQSSAWKFAVSTETNRDNLP